MLEKLSGTKKKDIHASVIKKTLRYLAQPIAVFLSKTAVTPNQISFTCFILSLVSAYLFYLQGYSNILLASLLLFFSLILDRVDGSLARIKNMSSDYGFWLDKTFDVISISIIFFGITCGVYNRTLDYKVWIFGYLGILSYMLMVSHYYDFKSIFSFGNNLISKERKNHQFLIQFYYHNPLISILIIFFALFNSLYWFLIFAGIYGPLCMVIQHLIFTYKIKKHIKLSPQSTQDEKI